MEALSDYGITLSRLTEGKIEMVRKWRNDPKISRYMAYREPISSQMQKEWFEKINNKFNFYFLIIFEGKEIGLINIRDIDYEKKEGEGGIFIYDDEYLNSDVSLRAHFVISDFIFNTLDLDRTIAHILSDNKRAIQYNKFIGYKIAENQENVLNQLYFLSKSDYQKSKIKISKLIT